ncbi:hypothetical protein P22_0013 [Propionispora sp. 2/2-37]|uniref:sensor histidine kinase n=1 Tax=Propionispora sp. 2/2-37 TaxID=1677858 RepID=UPI0006BB87D0|nr:HAMP domain-containing sensor histidine kinase [Propionispora sp. 2/2-37]CUH93951.1 hypothetical protein P22_0013 [Propionispora sp. 2/2-37]
MFAKIRNRLTVQYIMVMSVLLLSFIIVSYSGILWLLQHEEQQEIRAFAEEEAREHVDILKQIKAVPKDEPHDNSGGKLFSYVYDNQGRLVMADLPSSQIRSAVETAVGKWTMPDGVGEVMQVHLSNGEKVVFVMCSQHVYDGQEVMGRVYVGEDITSYYKMLKLMLIVLVIVAILFLFGAAYLGHFLAGKAIVPIRQSFLRQREFAADASHELRTPLSIMLTSVDAVQMDDGNRLTIFSAQTLADMKSEIKRMSKMVTALLTLARADDEAVNISKEKFNLYAVAEQVVRSCQLIADEKGIAIELLGQAMVPAFADKERIGQLLLILIDNAIKYTPSASTAKVSVKIVALKKSGFSIMVTDTGVGIPEEQKELIFERFYRVDKARSRAEGGVGLGLAIAKWIVESHGGTISVESSPGTGSSFIVTIPK